MTEVDLEESFGPGVLKFTKLHGNGNDFILIDELRYEIISEEMKPAISSILCDRHFGIGGDGVLYLVESDTEDIGMRLFQPDGSEAEMCGNGIRCLAKYAWDQGYVDDAFFVHTLAGRIGIRVRIEDGIFWARLDMGVPKFYLKSIPALGSGDFFDQTVEGYQVYAVNTGVPHAVIFVDDLDISIEDIAPPIRHNSIFPEGINVNFVNVGESFTIRTFERGVEGETLSCGTGSVASAAVARKLGLVDDYVNVITVGGPLLVIFEDDTVYLEGPAVTVFSGDLDISYIESLSEELL